MRYNKLIETRLEKLSFSDIRKTDDINSEKYIHDNQILAAKNIVKSFTAHLEGQDEHEHRNNHVVLVAKMQSGKTGTCNAVINILEKTSYSSYFHIDKYFYITGMNDNGLHNQTYERLCSDNKGQVINAYPENVCNGDKEIKYKQNAKIYVQKNSDLRKNNLIVKNCLIFIDESHYGSNENNVLTKFLEKNGIDWKNNKSLKDLNIYIVSVSATPFDEIISDLAECKTIVELDTNSQYIGISEYLDNDCIYEAQKNDFKLDVKNISYPILNYIQHAHDRIKRNENKGVIFIRTRDLKIKNNHYLKNNFRIVELDASKRGSIDYDSVSKEIELMILSPSDAMYGKPLLFFIKGAYRAGITLNPEHKDYVYMVYDNSIKPETTAQGLLGRMCGYRKDNNEFKKTIFYVNKQHAEDYAEWENDFKIKHNVPSSKSWQWVNDDYNGDELRIATKCNGNFEIKLSDDEIKRFIDASNNKDISNKEFSKNELRMLQPEFIFDYIGETYIAGKNKFSDSVINKWFDNFNINTNCPAYRPDSYFSQINNGRNQLCINNDLGKIICHIVLDVNINENKDKKTGKKVFKFSGNKRLLVYHGILSKKAKKNNLTPLIKKHKTTK